LETSANTLGEDIPLRLRGMALRRGMLVDQGGIEPPTARGETVKIFLILIYESCKPHQIDVP
jgi:hypothetical protein